MSEDQPDTSISTIIVPCYNEAERLDTDAFTAFARQQPQVRFLFVDDGSTDGTAGAIRTLADNQPQQLAALVLEKNGGKAEAVRQGMLHALSCSSFGTPAQYIGFWDADLATPLDDIPAFAALLDQRPELEMVFGSRVNLMGRYVKRKLLRHYIGRVFATAAAAVLQLPIYDTQCGAKLFRVSDELREVFAQPFISRWIFDVEIIARYQQLRRGTDRQSIDEIIYELPLMTWRDVAGSKIKASDFLVVGMDLIRIRMTYF